MSKWLAAYIGYAESGDEYESSDLNQNGVCGVQKARDG